LSGSHDRSRCRFERRGCAATVGRGPGHAEAGRQATRIPGLDRRGDVFRHVDRARHDERHPELADGRGWRRQSDGAQKKKKKFNPFEVIKDAVKDAVP
jgi:hypothetical protein